MAAVASFSMRFLDAGGAGAALAALHSALRAVAAPRALTDDVRLAVEIAMHDLLMAGDQGRGPAAAGAASGGHAPGGMLTASVGAGRVTVEIRTPSGVELDPALIGSLVDAVEVTREEGGVVTTLARDWNGPAGDRPAAVAAEPSPAIDRASDPDPSIVHTVSQQPTRDRTIEDRIETLRRDLQDGEDLSLAMRLVADALERRLERVRRSLDGAVAVGRDEVEGLAQRLSTRIDDHRASLDDHLARLEAAVDDLHATMEQASADLEDQDEH